MTIPDTVLMDADRREIVNKWKGGNWTAGDIIDSTEQAVLAKLTKKAEPVAVVIKFHNLGGEIDWTRHVICPVGTNLYTHPAADTALLEAAKEAADQLSRAKVYMELPEHHIDLREVTAAEKKLRAALEVHKRET